MRFRRSYSSRGEVPIYRCRVVTASEKAAVAASYSSTSRRFSAQPGRKMGANEAIIKYYDLATTSATLCVLKLTILANERTSHG